MTTATVSNLSRGEQLKLIAAKAAWAAADMATKFAVMLKIGFDNGISFVKQAIAKFNADIAQIEQDTAFSIVYTPSAYSFDWLDTVLAVLVFVGCAAIMLVAAYYMCYAIWLAIFLLIPNIWGYFIGMVAGYLGAVAAVNVTAAALIMVLSPIEAQYHKMRGR